MILVFFCLRIPFIIYNIINIDVIVVIYSTFIGTILVFFLKGDKREENHEEQDNPENKNSSDNTYPSDHFDLHRSHSTNNHKNEEQTDISNTDNDTTDD